MAIIVCRCFLSRQVMSITCSRVVYIYIVIIFVIIIRNILACCTVSKRLVLCMLCSRTVWQYKQYKFFLLTCVSVSYFISQPSALFTELLPLWREMLIDGLLWNALHLSELWIDVTDYLGCFFSATKTPLHIHRLCVCFIKTMVSICSYTYLKARWVIWH